MSAEAGAPPEAVLVPWIEASLAQGQHLLARGYQGQVLLYQDGGRRLVIKAPTGRGLLRALRRAMLRHEYRVYQALAGFVASPRCYGLYDDQYLVLEFVDGQSWRQARIEDRQRFFAGLLALIQDMHARGVAHGDLQKQDNIMLRADGRPCFIDFGVSVRRRSGFAPVNHYLFKTFRRMDLNVWVKLKYGGWTDDISDADRAYLDRSWVEWTAYRLKKRYRAWTARWRRSR